MSTYNEQLQQNNAELEEILRTAQSLPDATPTGTYIPIPETAAVGQTIRVSAVDENGKPTAWEATDFPSGGGGGTPDEYVLLFKKTFETALANTDEWGGESHMFDRRHFWTTDVDGNDVDADGFRVLIHVPSQSEVTSGEIKVWVGQGKPTSWMSWSEYQAQPYIGRATFVTANSERWAMWEYDLRKQTLKHAYVAGQTFKENFQGANQQFAISFPQAVSKNNWTSWSGVELELITGSLPAGTELLIYARKRNPDKFESIPSWEGTT